MRKSANADRAKAKTKKPTLTRETGKDLKLPNKGAGIVKGGGTSGAYSNATA